MGIEPTRPAWKAGILPLNYTRIAAALAVTLVLYHSSFRLSIEFLNFFIYFFIYFPRFFAFQNSVQNFFASVVDLLL